LEEAKKYHKLLSEINEKSDRNTYRFQTKYSNGLILKASKSFRDWSKAIDIFEQILEEMIDFIDSHTKVVVLMNLTELLIIELEQTGEKETLEKVRSNLNEIQSLAEENHLFTLKIDISRLQASFALLEFNIGKAKQILEETLSFAQDKEMQKSIMEIEHDLEALEKQSKLLADLQKENSPITNTLKHVKLANGIKKISQETNVEIRDEESGKVIEYRKLFALKI
jgi:hypothetical protein